MLCVYDFRRRLACSGLDEGCTGLITKSGCLNLKCDEVSITIKHTRFPLLLICLLLAAPQVKVSPAPKRVQEQPPTLRPRKSTSVRASRATSLCRADEQTLFSCKVADTKFASVCGSRRLDAKRGYVQYRFGRVGALEFEFPRAREATQRAFRYAHYFRARVDRTELSFESGGYSYVLYDYYEGDVRPVIKEAGVRVSAPGGGQEAVEIRCRSGVVSRLGLLSSVVPGEDGDLTPGEGEH